MDLRERLLVCQACPCDSGRGNLWLVWHHFGQDEDGDQESDDGRRQENEGLAPHLQRCPRPAIGLEITVLGDVPCGVRADRLDDERCRDDCDCDRIHHLGMADLQLSAHVDDQRVDHCEECGQAWNELAQDEDHQDVRGEDLRERPVVDPVQQLRDVADHLGPGQSGGDDEHAGHGQDVVVSESCEYGIGIDTAGHEERDDDAHTGE